MNEDCIPEQTEPGPWRQEPAPARSQEGMAPSSKRGEALWSGCRGCSDALIRA